MPPSTFLGCSRVLAIVEENGLEEILVGVCRLLGEIQGETPAGLLSSSGLIDLLSPNIQEVVMLLLGYSACLLIIHYSALLTRASGRATRRPTRRPTTAWCGGMSPLPPPAGAPRTAPSTRRGTKLQTPCIQGLRSASVSYRPPLAAAALCNPTAPAPSCRAARPLTPPTSSPVSKIFPRRPSWACRVVVGDQQYALSFLGHHRVAPNCKDYCTLSYIGRHCTPYGGVH